jgi:hypothetical protein
MLRLTIFVEQKVVNQMIVEYTIVETWSLLRIVDKSIVVKKTVEQKAVRITLIT